MRSFCCGSISAKSDVLGAACQSASSSSFASASPVSIDVGSSPTVSARWPVTKRLSPVMTLTSTFSFARSPSTRAASALGGSRKSRKPAKTISASSSRR